ncbi:MAG: VWA domain-containing protein [Bacteroidota bacterium]
MNFSSKYVIAIIVLLCSLNLFSQNSLINIDAKSKDIGTVENIYKVKVDFIISNKQAKNLYLLRADAEKGISIQTSKKTIKENDTAIIVVEFIPEQIGKFSKVINLITSADGLPFKIEIKGIIKSIKSDDKTACFYFKKPNGAGVKTIEPIVVSQTNKPLDRSNKIPDHTVDTSKYKPSNQVSIESKKLTPSASIPELSNELDDDFYKPNNIIFLVDVSSSMKDTSKLKVMQYALHYLIDALRTSDKITFITYADSVKTLVNGVSGSNKNQLHQVVDLIKAKGITKGKKAILYSLDFALLNYIEGGNNQIMLATDGKFRFDEDDQKTYILRKQQKQIILTTLAFGEDKEALKNLKEISKIGNGHFIPLKNKAKAKVQLLEEVKQNSLIK